MGANATGKTNLGKALQKIFTYVDTGNQAGPITYRFACLDFGNSELCKGLHNEVLLKTFSAVLGILDPTFKDISLSKDLKDTFLVRKEKGDLE